MKRHITDLKIFHYDESYKDNIQLTLSEIAMRDRIHEFPVETVLAHRFKRKSNGALGNKSSDLEFHIRWKGFNSRWDSWEPYSNVRLSTIVIDYLSANKLKRFIPRLLDGELLVPEIQPASILNRIFQDNKNSNISEERKKKVQFKSHSTVQDSMTIPSLDLDDETRWVYDKHSHSWLSTENIRLLGPY